MPPNIHADASLFLSLSIWQVDAMGYMQRLAALLELTRAEEEERFSPAAYDLSTDEATRVAAVFAEYDKNSDGIVDEEELGELLGALGGGEKLADDEIKLAMKMLDSNGRGTVNLEEFTAWFTGGCPLPGRAASLLEAEEAEAEEEEAAAAATGAMEAMLLVEAANAELLAEAAVAAEASRLAAAEGDGALLVEAAEAKGRGLLAEAAEAEAGVREIVDTDVYTDWG